MNRLQWGLYRARKGLQQPREVRLALRRRMIAVFHAKRLRQMMEIEWYAAKRGITRRGWRGVVYDYAKRGFPGDADPHPLFSTSWYMHHNPEIVTEGTNPLVHYLQLGEGAGRSPHPLFDPEHYGARVGNDQPAGLSHFLRGGDRAGLSPHPSFEPEHYRAGLPEGADPTFTAFLMDPTPRHAPNAWLSPLWYVHRYPIVGREGMNPLYHYERWGRAQGLLPAPVRRMTELPELALRERHEEILRGLQQGSPLLVQQAVAGEAESYGAVVAPLIGGYALFALERARMAGVDTMYFFTREGEFVGEAVRELINADVFGLAETGHEYPRVAVLEVSRMATFAASLDNIDRSSLMRIWNLYSTQSAMALGKTLKISPEILAAACSRVGLRPEEQITHPWESPQVHDLLKDPEFMNAANQRRLYDREALFQYLESHGIDRNGSEPLFVVDLGWRGSIQDNLAHLLPDRTIRGIYLGLVEYLNPQPPNVEKAAWLFDKNKGEELGRSVAGSVIETLFNASGGTVMGYATEDGITAIRDVHEPEEAALAEAYRPVQLAALAALPAFADWVRLNGSTSGSLRDIGLLRLDEHVQLPLSTLASGFERVGHNETFGKGERVVSTFEPNHLDVARGNAAFFESVASEVRASIWRAGRARLIDEHAADELSDAYRDWMPRQVRSLEPGFADLAAASACIQIPPLIDGSTVNGPIARLAAKLVDYGLDTTVAMEQIDNDGERYLANFLGRVPVSVDVGRTGAASYDIAIATSAQSAHLVADSVNSSQRAYVVQDLEDVSNAISARSMHHEHPMAHLTIGHWLTHLIQSEHGGGAAGAGPGINHGAYYPNGQHRENALCFLYQPEKSRGNVELAVETLQRFSTICPEVEILIYGSDAEMPVDLETTHLGNITDIDGLNALYNRCKAALCISTTNLSRLPFELMASGVIPVDLYRYNNLFDYADGTGILVYQSPDSLARALASIFEGDEEFTRRSQACIDHAAYLTYQWEAEVLANGVMSMLATGRLRQPPVTLSYKDSPFVSRIDRRPESMEFLDAQQRRANASSDGIL